MKKSIYLFIGGSLFGAIISVAIVKLTLNDEQTNPVASNNNAVKIQTVKLPKSTAMPEQSTESMSDMQVRLSQQPGMSDTMDMYNTPQDNPEENAQNIPSDETSNTEPATAQPQITEKAPTAIPATPPTAEQVEQYNNIEKIISTAANNPKIKLYDILRKSNNLTIQQRNQLTQKTIDMLSRGELSIEQFSDKQPDS